MQSVWLQQTFSLDRVQRWGGSFHCEVCRRGERAFIVLNIKTFSSIIEIIKVVVHYVILLDFLLISTITCSERH